VWFDIDIEEARVPAEADYLGYYVTATERETQKAKVYFAMIKKSLCGTKDGADCFLQGRPLDFLQTEVLDLYGDGEVRVLWPDVTKEGWIVTPYEPSGWRVRPQATAS
jgi:hypothetical protein